MIHAVYFWTRPDLSESERQTLEAGLRSLAAIDLVQTGRVGKPAPTAERPVTDHSFSYSLMLEFATLEDHNAYQDHPDHHVFVANCKAFWERVVVYDSESL